MTELLAPAGSMEALKAAIANGADAVYVGGKQFSARAFADNFDDDELGEALELTHFHDKKLYLAVNTLLNDRELQQALEYIAHYYALGLDAVIVQDIGLLSLLHQHMPDLPVHASTQMTVSNAAGARFLAAQGVKRVILARELSFAEIRQIREQAEVELEAFVHGALCVCYSGQCLMSSMIGGRSGNRGRCAQPCRMVYTLTDAFGDALPLKPPGDYLLSPRDLVGYWRMEDLHELGLAAWKIEGRMKKPEYVATVCRIYGQHLHLLDQRRVIYLEEEEQRQLLQMFNRDHCYGYWDGNQGAAMMSYKRPNNRGVFLGRIQSRNDGDIVLKLDQPLNVGDGLEIWVTTGGRSGMTVETISQGGEAVSSARAGEVVTIPATAGKSGDRVFKTYDIALHQQAQQSYAKLADLPLYFTIQAVLGQPLRVAVRDGKDFRAEMTSSYTVEEALTSMSDWQTVQAQLGRLGGSGYYLAGLDGELQEGVMLPASVLNACRRELLAALAQQYRRHRARPAPTLPHLWPLAEEPQLAVQQITLAALTDDSALAPRLAKAGMADIYFGTEGLYPQPAADAVDWPALLHSITEAGARLVVSLPQIIKAEEEAAWAKRIAAWQQAGITALRINHAGQWQIAADAGWQGALLGGPGLNIYNSQSLRFYSELGLESLTLSPEADLVLLKTMAEGGAPRELLAQGALPLMVSEYCALGAVAGGRDQKQACKKPCKRQGAYGLRDEKGFFFPCRSDAACRMHIFNSRELCLLEEIPQLKQAGISRLCLDMRLYDQPKALRLAELYRLACGDMWSFEEAKEKLAQVMHGFTKGHLHRGV